MKKAFVLTVLLMAGILSSCQTGNGDGGKGSRSNPYQFGDEISVTAYDYNKEMPVDFTFSFSDFYDGAEMQMLYPSYQVDEDYGVRGAISVHSDETSDSIYFDNYVSAQAITSELNEINARFDTFTEDDPNTFLNNVYSDGYYDIVLDINASVYPIDFSYITLKWRNKSGENQTAWIEIPEDLKNPNQPESSEQLSEPSSDTGSSSVESNSSEETINFVSSENTNEPSSSSETVEEPELSEEDLDALLADQPLAVLGTDYVVQDPQYKALYPDLLKAVFVNNTSEDIKDAVIAFVAWDQNGLPVKIKGQFDFSDGSYVKMVNYSDINLIGGATYGESSGLALAEGQNIDTFKAIAVSYETFEGKTWETPYFDDFCALYEGKKMS